MAKGRKKNVDKVDVTGKTVASIRLVSVKCGGYDIKTGHEIEILADGGKRKKPTFRHVNCADSFDVEETTYTDGTIVVNKPSHMMCAKCRTVFVTNYRVDKLKKDCELIGNLRLRIVKDIGAHGLSAVMAECEQAFSSEIITRFTGDVIVATVFDLMTAKVE